MAVVVPRYEQGQVRQQNLPNARYSDAGANVGADQVGAALGRVAGTLGQIAVQEQEKIDTAAAMSAEATLRGEQNTMLFGTGDGQNRGAFGTEGSDAFGVVDRTLPNFEKRRSEIAGSLKGGARAIFERRTSTWGEDMRGDLLRHTAGESEKYRAAAEKAYQEQSLNTAVLYYNRPDRVDATIRDAQDTFIAQNPGLHPEALKVGLGAIESSTRRAVLTRMMTESPSQAQAYYEAHRGQFTGTDQAEIERVLVPLAKADRGEQIGREVWSGGAGATGYAAFRRALESGGDANARNPNSSATGADQFTEGTWLRMVKAEQPAWAQGRSRDEILAMRTDPEKSGQMAAALDRESAATLTSAGMPVTNENLYAAHHFGAGAGVKFARASLDTPIESVLSAEAIEANPYLRGKTKGDVIANWNARAGRSVSVGASVADKKQFILDTVTDDTERKAALNYVEMQDTLTKQREAEAEKSMIETINTKVEQSDPSMPFAKIVTPEELAWAQESGRVGAWEARLKQRVAGTDEATPRDVLLAYRTVVGNAARGDKVALSELAKYNPYDPNLRMSQSDRDWLAKSQADIFSGDPAKVAKAASEGEINDIIRTYTVNTLGVGKGMSGGKLNAKLGSDPTAIEFDRNMRLWADQFQREHKRAPTYTEFLKQADTMTLDKLGYTREVPGRLYGTREIEESVADLNIPANMQRLIVEALYAEGKPVNGANVAAKWRAYIKANSTK